MQTTFDNDNLPWGFRSGLPLYLPLDAFNLIPGAAFMVPDQPDPRVWIAERVVRDDNFECVYIWAHDGSNHSEGLQSGLSFEKAFDLNYSQQVALVGLVVTPEARDDNNWGVNL